MRWKYKALTFSKFYIVHKNYYLPKESMTLIVIGKMSESGKKMEIELNIE